MDAIARLPEFDKLARIPTAQIPWISSRAPRPLRELLWGFRSTADQFLIRRVLRSRNPHKRQRVLRSLDFIKEYRREGSVPAVREWFSGKWLSGELYARTVTERAELLAWPLINSDITVPANVSIILDSCDVDIPHRPADRPVAAPESGHQAGLELNKSQAAND